MSAASLDFSVADFNAVVIQRRKEREEAAAAAALEAERKKAEEHELLVDKTRRELINDLKVTANAGRTLHKVTTSHNIHLSCEGRAWHQVMTEFAKERGFTVLYTVTDKFNLRGELYRIYMIGSDESEWPTAEDAGYRAWNQLS